MWRSAARLGPPPGPTDPVRILRDDPARPDLQRPSAGPAPDHSRSDQIADQTRSDTRPDQLLDQTRYQTRYQTTADQTRYQTRPDTRSDHIPDQIPDQTRYQTRSDTRPDQLLDQTRYQTRYQTTADQTRYQTRPDTRPDQIPDQTRYQTRYQTRPDTRPDTRPEAGVGGFDRFDRRYLDRMKARGNYDVKLERLLFLFKKHEEVSVKGSMPPSIGHMELLVWMQRAVFSEHIQDFKSPGDPLNSSHFDAPNTKSAPTGYRRAPNIISHHYKHQLSAKASIVPKA